VAYRILTEALTNVVRHSTASAVDVQLGAQASELLLTVQDNGSGDGRSWRAGLGLTSMRERVSELDGDVEAGPTSRGGRVRVRIPLEATV
jgi:signal transduction histidine kinase